MVWVKYSVFIIGAMLNTKKGMLHTAFNGAVYKKSQSGLLTRGNAIRQKGKIFSILLQIKFPGKWFLGASLAQREA